MYTVNPYINVDEKVEPADVMYPLDSYVSSVCCSNGDECQEHLVGEVIGRQLKLIEELAAFIGQLNVLILGAAGSSSKYQQSEVACKKSEANALLKEETGINCLPAMPPFKSSFCPSAIKLTGGCAEENFLKYLAVLGARAGVLFDGFPAQIDSPRCTVKFVTVGDECEDCVTVVDDGITVTGRVSAWKLLGSVVGAYPAAGAQGDANIATHIDRWLVLIEQALSKGAEDGLSRQMSSALSGQDYLVPGATGATLADILAYSVMSNQIYYANNVELWLRRMHKLFN